MSFRLCCLGFINLVTFVISAVVVGVWSSKSGAVKVDGGITISAANNRIIIVAAFIMITSAAGFVGSYCRVRWLLRVYFVFLLILLLICMVLAIRAFLMTNKGSGEALPGKEYKEYRLGDYPNGIQKIVNDTQFWNQTKTLMVNSKVCTILNTKYLNDTVGNFYKHPLTAIQSGCCKPSNDCGFTYRSPTNWTEENGVYNNPDCKAWDNDQKVLCFNCQSCKAAVADKLKHGMRKVAKINMMFFFILIILFCIGCYAYRKDLRASSYNNQPV